MNWKLSQDGLTASRTLDNGAIESRMVSAIPADELANALPADPLPPPTTLEQIQALEATITTRRIRESVLGIDGGWLANVDAQIAALRASL